MQSISGSDEHYFGRAKSDELALTVADIGRIGGEQEAPCDMTGEKEGEALYKVDFLFYLY